MILRVDYFTEKDIFFYHNLWHCFEVHSALSNPDKEEFLEVLNELVHSTHHYILTLSHGIITMGTSWVYRHIELNEIVANCHKVPQKQFAKELLSVEAIGQSLENIISLVHSVNKEVTFVFTVSPVRHIKDGFVENTVSKSHLVSALYTFIEHNAAFNYFPSYEIMLDELRDYRFYAEDMLHPNQTEIDYIWMQFWENFINTKAFATMQEVSDIQKALQHKPFHPDSVSHQQFLVKLKDKIKMIQQKSSGIRF